MGFPKPFATIKKHNMELTKYLLEDLKAEVNTIDEQGNNGLFWGKMSCVCETVGWWLTVDFGDSCLVQGRTDD